MASPTASIHNKADLISYLHSLETKGAISCQYIANNTNFNEITTINTNTGFWVGALGIDYYWYGAVGNPADTSANANAKTWWTNGGLVVLTTHFGTPSLTPSGAPANGGVYDCPAGQNGNPFTGVIDWNVLTTSGNSLNTKLNGILDSIAAGILDLANSGISVIYRPYHESDGNWFWWGTASGTGVGGANPTTAQFIALWRYTHDYISNKTGVGGQTLGNNIAWAFTGVDQAGGVLHNWPENAQGQYVDVVGDDIYTNTPGGDSNHVARYNAEVSTGKVIIVAEFGPSSVPFDETVWISALKTSYPKAVLWQQWDSGSWGIEFMQNATTALSNSYVYNRGSLPVFSAPVGSAPGYVIDFAGKTPSLVDSTGANWNLITATPGPFQATVNGTGDPAALDVNFLMYYNGAIYEQRNVGNWFTKIHPTDAWTGSVGDPRSTSASGYFVDFAGKIPSVVNATLEVFALITATGGSGLALTAKGNIDTTAVNPDIVLYYNSLVYYQNNSGGWFSKTKAADAWVGPQADPRGSGTVSGTRVVAPLTGTVTKGSWVLTNRLNVTAMPNGFIAYDYLLPQGYDSTANTIYPLLFYGHQNNEGGTSTYPASTIVNQSVIDGTFNTVAFRTNYPCIVVIPYCDQTDGKSGTGENFGGYADSTNSGGNEQGVNALALNFSANFKVDTTRRYCTGDSLGATGTLSWLVDNNAVSGVNKIWIAGMGLSEKLFRTAANSTVFPAMKNIVYIAVSTPNDNDPTSYDQPAWTFYTGNSTYPTTADFASNGVSGLRASTSNFYYMQMTSAQGNPWDTYRQLTADGGKGTPLYDLLFAQTSGPVSSGSFLVSKGIILDPLGNNFIGRGINIYGSDIETVVIDATGKPLTTLFPGLTIVRVADGGYRPSTAYTTFVTRMTALKIVVVFEDHTGISATPYTGTALTTEINWYTDLATAFKNNSYVWFGTFNEPGGKSGNSAVTTQEVAIYNAIRNAGNSNPILMELVGGGNPGTLGTNGGLTVASYGTMTNVIWDLHLYDWSMYNPAGGGTNGKSSDPTIIAQNIALYISQTQQIQSKDGVMPVIIGEYGISTDDQTADAGGVQLTQGVQASGKGSMAWHWHSGGALDNLTDGNGNLTTYGSQVAAWIAAGPKTINPSANNTTVLAGSASLITDSTGATWGINASAQVTQNGVADTTTSGVVELAYVNGTVWYKNSSGNWFSRSNGLWSSPTTVSPLPVVSPDQTVILAGSTGVITDAAFNRWSITGAQAVINGVVDTRTGNVTEIAWAQGLIWLKDNVGNWYSIASPTSAYSAGTQTSPLSTVPGGLGYLNPMKQAGLRVITYIKQQSPAGFTTGLANLRGEQAANHDIYAYEGCQEPDTAVITGTQETIAAAASFQTNVWNAGLADGVPVIQTSFGVLADYGTTGNLASVTTYGNAHTYPGSQNSSANYAVSLTNGFIAGLTADAQLTSPGRSVAHTEFGGWLADHNSPTAIASYVLNFICSGYLDFNLPYYIVQGLYDDSKNGQVGLFNSDQTPRLVATALSNWFTLLKDTASTSLSFGPGQLNVSISNLPASPSGTFMGGSFGVLQKSDGSFWVYVWNEQNLTTTDAAGHTAIVVAPVSCTMTLGKIATTIDVYDPLISTVAQQHVANSSSFTFSLPSHPILIRIVRP